MAAGQNLNVWLKKNEKAKSLPTVGQLPQALTLVTGCVWENDGATGGLFICGNGIALGGEARQTRHIQQE